jgi:glucan phosphoethanolaminetransferase (alkaline phosphatase superfamily)
VNLHPISGSKVEKAALAVFALEFTLFDVALRGTAPYFDEPRLACTAVGSGLVGLLFGSLSRRRWARAAIAAVWSSVMVIEAIVFRYYHTMIDRQVLASTVHAWSDVKPVVITLIPGTVPLIALAALVHYGLLSLAADAWEPGRRARVATAALSLVAFAAGAPLRRGTPEVRLAEALALAWPEKAAAAMGPAQVSLMPSRRKALPNVLFILTESVRSEDYPAEYDPHSPIAPEMGALFPERAVFRQMRSVASYTAVSVSALLSGHPQLGKRDDILAAPTLFDFLRAVRHGEGQSRPQVAYFSAQSEHLFERDGVRSMVDSFASMETLLGHEVDDEDQVIDLGLDRKVADHTVSSLPSLRAPYFLMLHLGGTHAPYFVEPGAAPFTPWERTVTWSRMPPLHNAYKDAIFEQDKSIAKVAKAFLAAQGETPWVVIFTSDHGESFGEHGAIHHGQNLYDEQIHVPAFVASGNGALDSDEVENLRARREEMVTHLDLLPTVLDAYGIRPSALAGESLLRPPATTPRAALAITNCTEMFPCPIGTWGMAGRDRLLVAQPWDRAFHCMHARTGAELDAADATCAELRTASAIPFPQLPNGAPNR